MGQALDLSMLSSKHPSPWVCSVLSAQTHMWLLGWHIAHAPTEGALGSKSAIFAGAGSMSCANLTRQRPTGPCLLDEAFAVRCQVMQSAKTFVRGSNAPPPVSAANAFAFLSEHFKSYSCGFYGGGSTALLWFLVLSLCCCETSEGNQGS
jgi:hypothetical protein